MQKLMEAAQLQLVGQPTNWQQVFILLKSYLNKLSKRKKQVIFLDELPWMSTNKSGFLQMLAHLWNDYLSKEKHFILVVCGSATSWITQKIVSDKGGLHNRLTEIIQLQPFTLIETKAFLASKKIQLSNSAIVELYMALGGILYYLEQIKKGETVTVALEGLCFSKTATLKNEYDNLYIALFDHPENYEAVVATLATVKNGLSRTTPFIAKAYQIPFLNYATKIMLGVNKIGDFTYEKKLTGFAIKEPVFSFNKFPGVNKELGPEMKSTGEAIRFIKDLRDPYFRQLYKDRSMYLSK
jgi:hypothetical protein